MENEKDKTSNLIFNKLLYRNQFILGSFFIEELTSWKRIKINSSLHLNVHPNLNTYQAVYENKSITLLGFILDPNNPQASDSDIINGLLHKLSNCDTFCEHTYDFGGRWILLLNDGKDTLLLHDASGLRQVFYTDMCYIKDLWCASQPGIIAQLLSLKMDTDAVDFINSYEVRKNTEFRFPCDSSPYKEIKHLLPNHYLNLTTGLCKRYWPNKPLHNLALEDGLEKSSEILKALMKSASNRFDLALGLTAGLDSRLVLAASKDISNKLSYSIVRQIDMPEDCPDITIPSTLLSKLGLKQDVVKSSFIIHDEFINIFKKNVTLPHYIYAPDAYAILEYYFLNKVAVTGSVSEITRWPFRSQMPRSRWKKVTAYDLSLVQNMRKNQFAIKHFESWLSRLGEIYNVNVLDLFEWEQGHGVWLPMCQLEFDIAWKDIFTPFNCRNLLISMLSIEEKYRRPPKYILYEKLIFKLWPEVLSVPINPHKKKRFNFLMKSYINIKSQLARYLPDSIKRRVKGSY